MHQVLNMEVEASQVHPRPVQNQIHILQAWLGLCRVLGLFDTCSFMSIVLELFWCQYQKPSNTA